MKVPCAIDHVANKLPCAHALNGCGCSRKPQHKWIGARVKSFTTDDKCRETIADYGRITQVIKSKAKSNCCRAEWDEYTGFDPETYPESTIKKVLVTTADV